MSSRTSNSDSKGLVNVRLLMSRQFDEAKQWWFWANTSRFLVVIITIVSLLWKEGLEWIWAIAALLTAGYTIFQWRADYLQGRTEAIKRKLEFQDGLGWTISEREKSDLILEASNAAKKMASGTEESPYFDSQEAVSPRRTVENLKQSAWYTRHQAKLMARYVLAGSAIVFVLAFILIVVILQSPPLQELGPSIGRIVITVLSFAIANGYVRLGFRYRFSFTTGRKNG